MKIKCNEDLFNKIKNFEKFYNLGDILSPIVQNDTEITALDLRNIVYTATEKVKNKQKDMDREYKDIIDALAMYIHSCES